MGNSPKPSAKPGTISLRKTEFERLCRERNLTTDTEIARAFGVTRSAVWKIRAGATMPSERFIAGALRAWKGVEFERIFRAVDYVPRGKGKAA